MPQLETQQRGVVFSASRTPIAGQCQLRRTRTQRQDADEGEWTSEGASEAF